MKQAILVVSYGTASVTSLEKSIFSIEQALAAAFPERTFHRAFTGLDVRRTLFRRDRQRVDGVVEALEELCLEGYHDILVQPTQIINGREMERIRAETALYSHQFRRLALGAPLLDSWEDYTRLAQAIMGELPEISERDALVLVGRGTPHHAGCSYAALEYVFHLMGYNNVFVGTAEGHPSLPEVISRLDGQLNIRRVYLAPLVVAADDAFRSQLTGANCWRDQLKARNYQTFLLWKELGEYAAIRERYVAHAREALARRRK